MTINYLLIWIVCSGTIAFIFTVRSPTGWIGVCGAVAGMIVLAYWFPALAGFVGGGLWFFLLPKIVASWVNQLTIEQQYGKARRLASCFRWLPSDNYLPPKLLLALEMSQQGHLAQAVEMLERYEGTSVVSLQAQAMIYWLKADWDKCLQLMQTVPEKVLFKPPLLLYYLRALGETGDLNGLLQAIGSAEPHLQKTGDRLNLNLIRLWALAFCGRTEQIRRLLAGSVVYSATIQKFWLVTAQLAAGQDIKEQLLALYDKSDSVLKNAIAWRLSHPPVNPQQVLSDSSRQRLAHIQIALQSSRSNRQNDSRQFDLKMTNYSGRIAFATYGLISLNLLFFWLEVERGGSENLTTLYNLGALDPQAVWSGQWWRLLSANFLHFGWLHLLTNMLGLYLIGRAVEFSLGIGRFLTIYLVSGVGAMFSFTFWTMKLGNQDQILVGASAAIMGLVGVIGAIFLQGWRREKSPLAAKRLRFIILVIVIQFALDLATPQVSFLSHLLGLIIGFLVGNILLV